MFGQDPALSMLYEDPNGPEKSLYMDAVLDKPKGLERMEVCMYMGFACIHTLCPLWICICMRPYT